MKLTWNIADDQTKLKSLETIINIANSDNEFKTNYAFEFEKRIKKEHDPNNDYSLIYDDLIFMDFFQIKTQ